MDASYPLWLGKLPGIPRWKMERAPLYPYKDAHQLEQSLDAGVQFRRLNWRRLMAWRPDQLRVVLISPKDYYAAQAAAHLTALDLLSRPRPDWAESAFEDTNPQDLSRHLTVVDVSMLRPGDGGAKPLRLSELDTPAVLIRGEQVGAELDTVLEQLEDVTLAAPPARPMHVFLVLRPEQVDVRQLADLQLRYAFRVGVVGEPDMPYLGRQLRALCQELLPTAENICWEELVRQVQEIRGSEFVETDLVCIPTLALMNGTSIPATQEDLTPKLFDLSVLAQT